MFVSCPPANISPNAELVSESQPNSDATSETANAYSSGSTDNASVTVRKILPEIVNLPKNLLSKRGRNVVT